MGFISLLFAFHGILDASIFKKDLFVKNGILRSFGRIEVFLYSLHNFQVAKSINESHEFKETGAAK